jgi:hypothetical protein
MDKYAVHVQEEYGYREWLWAPDMTIEELKVWWKNLPTVAPYFFEGPVNFPGEIHQIYFHEPFSFSFIKEVEGRTVVPLHPDPLVMPEDIIHMHIHEDSDSYLVIDGVSYNHAGYVTYDEYNDEDYESAPEVKDAWGKALNDDVIKKFGSPKEDK